MAIMKPSFLLFWTFIKHLGKKWILWLFLALDLLAAVVQIFFAPINLPQGVYVGVFIVGLVWASFETYLDLLTRIPSEARPLQPDISIFFVEGGEYSYTLEQLSDILSPEELKLLEYMQEENAKEKTEVSTLPNAHITLHIKIENPGLVAVSLLTIGGNIDFNEPYQFMIPKVSNPDGTSVSFPVKLAPKELLHFHAAASIFPYSLLTDAQIAARTRKLREHRASIEAMVFAEAIDPAGKIYEYRAVHRISLMPLCNLYTSLWERLGRHDLVALATGETNSNVGGEIGEVPA